MARRPTAKQLAAARGALLSYLPAERIFAELTKSPGDELAEKFANAESSAALVANTFGFFLDRPQSFPPLDCLADCGWPPETVAVEQEMRFPWRGGRHPWLDAVIRTRTHLIGVESKRYEPFRARKSPRFSKKYWSCDWGEGMRPFTQMRDRLHSGELQFTHLDAVQLVKHAFGLRTQAAKQKRQAILFYLYAEPKRWANAPGGVIDPAAIERHAIEVAHFARDAADAEVQFRSCAYRELTAALSGSPGGETRDHAAALLERYDL